MRSQGRTRTAPYIVTPLDTDHAAGRRDNSGVTDGGMIWTAELHPNRAKPTRFGFSRSRSISRACTNPVQAVSSHRFNNNVPNTTV